MLGSNGSLSKISLSDLATLKLTTNATIAKAGMIIFILFCVAPMVVTGKMKRN